MKLTQYAVLSALVLLVPALPSAAQERGPAQQRDARERVSRLRAERGQRTERREQGLRSLRDRLQHARDFVRKLGITDEQRAIARECSAALKPLADEVRPQVNAIREKARDLRRAGDREALRNLLENELRPLVRSARERAEPLVQPLIRSLTPEQRAHIDAAAARRGKQIDHSRLSARLALRLARRSR
jgi:hypothetical protein